MMQRSLLSKRPPSRRNMDLQGDPSAALRASRALMRFAQDIWENPRGNRLGRGVWNNCEAILAACCGALELPDGQNRAHRLIGTRD